MHPFFHTLVRLHLAKALRRSGKGFREAGEIVAQLSADDIDAAAAAPEVSAPVVDAAAGSHPIIDAIVAWLGGPGGQALIAILLKLLGL